jgi:hypothetical protein
LVGPALISKKLKRLACAMAPGGGGSGKVPRHVRDCSSRGANLVLDCMDFLENVKKLVGLRTRRVRDDLHAGKLGFTS